MIDKEMEVFNVVATALRERYPDAYIIPKDISSKPSRFPAVSIICKDNGINTRYSTFDKVENVARTEFNINIYSNDVDEKEEICKEISILIDDVMSSMRYIRTLNEPMVNDDDTIERRVMRYTKQNEI